MKKTKYDSYAKIAFEEAIRSNPGNTFILLNYMLYLLELKDFDQFQKMMSHVKTVMAKDEIDMLQKLHSEF